MEWSQLLDGWCQLVQGKGLSSEIAERRRKGRRRKGEEGSIEADR